MRASRGEYLNVLTGERHEGRAGHVGVAASCHLSSRTARAVVNAPPFRAEHIGSLLRPQKASARTAARGQVSSKRSSGRRGLGLKVVTDGEFRRESWRLGFVSKVAGFARADAVGNVDLQRDEAGNVMRVGSAPVAVTRILRTGPIVADEVAFSLKHTDRVKATLPAPSYLHYPRGRNCVDRDVYPDLEEFFADVVRFIRMKCRPCTPPAAATCRSTRWRRPCFATRSCATRCARGDDPEKLVDLYIDLINRVVRERPAGMTAGVHMCRGNAMGEWIAEGGYERIAEKSFSRMEVDAFFLEFDSERAGGFEPRCASFRKASA